MRLLLTCLAGALLASAEDAAPDLSLPSATESRLIRLKRRKGSHMAYRRNQPFAHVVVPAHRSIDTGTLAAIIHQAEPTIEEFTAFL
jgi:hypothetical protein